MYFGVMYVCLCICILLLLEAYNWIVSSSKRMMEKSLLLCFVHGFKVSHEQYQVIEKFD